MRENGLRLHWERFRLNKPNNESVVKIRTGCPRSGRVSIPRGILEDTHTQHLGTWFSAGLGSVRFMAGL